LSSRLRIEHVNGHYDEGFWLFGDDGQDLLDGVVAATSQALELKVLAVT
jgi:hypothetical protein